MPITPLDLLYRGAGPWGPGFGANFDAPDFDGNNFDIQTAVNALIAAVEAFTPGLGLASVSPFTFVGNLMTVHLSDGSTRGPFPINVGWVLREFWEAGETYLDQNLVIGPEDTPYEGAAYLVKLNHVAALTFDPLATDGLGNRLYGLLLPALKPAVPINDIHVFNPGVMIDNQLILDNNATRPWTIAPNLLGSIFRARTAATAPVTVHLFQNSTEVGQINWAAGATIPTVAFLFRVDFNTGDIFEIRGPLIADATLADITFDIVGNRL